MCDDVYDPPEADSREWRTARKTHRCFACWEPILAGDRYHHTTIVRERGEKPERYKHCVRCWWICEALWKAGAESIEFDLNCGDTWEDNFDPETTPEPAALAFMTRDEAQELVRRRP